MFLLQPRVMMFTLSLCSVFVFISMLFKAEKAVDKFVFVKNEQVFHLFADADEFDGDPELVGDSQDYPALRGSVELGDGQGGDRGSGRELAGLFEGILAGG